MSILDNITAGITGQLQGKAGGSGGMINAALQLMNSPEIGGPTGMVQALAKQGEENVVASWVAPGTNLPISADALLKLFGQEKIHQMASGMGMSIPSFLSGLTAVLPEMIDKISSGGMLPPNEEAGDILGDLARNYFRN